MVADMHTTTCDFCGATPKKRMLKNIDLKCGSDHPMGSLRDFCDDYCLRDFLVGHITAYGKPINLDAAAPTGESTRLFIGGVEQQPVEGSGPIVLTGIAAIDNA